MLEPTKVVHDVSEMSSVTRLHKPSADARALPKISVIPASSGRPLFQQPSRHVHVVNEAFVVQRKRRVLLREGRAHPSQTVLACIVNVFRKQTHLVSVELKQYNDKNMGSPFGIWSMTVFQ